MMRKSMIGTAVYLLLGPIAWAAHMTVVYAVQSTLCALARERSGLLAVDVVIALATGGALALILAAARRPDWVAARLGASEWPSSTQLFNRRVMVLLAILSVFGIVAAGAARLLLPTCAQLR